MLKKKKILGLNMKKINRNNKNNKNNKRCL